MKIEGIVQLPAAPPAVWALLTDPVSLARLLPGCERLDPDGPDRFKAAVKFGIAAISGKYAGSVKFSRKKPPHSLALTLDGKGLPGFVHAEGSLALAAHGPRTEVRYSGEAQVGGMIASVGQRMLEAAARRIVQQFFEAAAAELETRGPGASSGAPVAKATPKKRR
jgi:carbon monoxide dehydrogenase subunit G